MSTWTMQQAIETQFEVWMKEKREKGSRATPYNALQCILHTTTEDFPKEMTKQFENLHTCVVWKSAAGRATENLWMVS